MKDTPVERLRELQALEEAEAQSRQPGQRTPLRLKLIKSKPAQPAQDSSQRKPAPSPS